METEITEPSFLAQPLIENLVLIELGKKDRFPFAFNNDSALIIGLSVSLFYELAETKDVTHEDLTKIYLKESRDYLKSYLDSLYKDNCLLLLHHRYHLSETKKVEADVILDRILDVVINNDVDSLDAFVFVIIREYGMVNLKKHGLSREEVSTYMATFKKEHFDFYKIVRNSYRLLS